MREEKRRRPVIGFDMGGTSTDVSRYGGAYEHVFETTTAGKFLTGVATKAILRLSRSGH